MGVRRIKTVSVATAALFLLGVQTVVFSESLRNAKEYEEGELELELNQLGATNIVNVLGGLIPEPISSLTFEVNSIASDTLLKHTPAVLDIPKDKEFDPQDKGQADECYYKISSDSNFKEDTSSLFFITHNKLDNVWPDLADTDQEDSTKLEYPKIFHPDADVSVRVSNAYLGQDGPGFPAGYHNLTWTAETSINWVLDVGLPAALIPTFSLAEMKLTGKVWSSKFAKLSLATDLGLIVVDVTNAAEAEQWYQDTSQITAINSKIQKIKVWDHFAPYYQDATTLSTVADQALTFEAEDFGGIRLGRISDTLRSRFIVSDDCNRQLKLRRVNASSQLLKSGETTAIQWRANDGGPYLPFEALANNQIRDGENVYAELTQFVTVEDTQPPILVPPPGFALEASTEVLPTELFLGKAKVVDRADPNPTITVTAPPSMSAGNNAERGNRYAITYSATDYSGNKTQDFTQWVTIKEPGSNTAPMSQDASASGITADKITISLTANDNDVIDGRPDPLAFHIWDQPQQGAFEEQVYPYFIEDLRAKPETVPGGNDTAANLACPVNLGDGKALNRELGKLYVREHQAYVEKCYCTSTPTTPPVNFIYQPSYIHVRDDGVHYAIDRFFRCESRNAQTSGRLSAWNDNELLGEFGQNSTNSVTHISVDEQGVITQSDNCSTCGGNRAQSNVYELIPNPDAISPDQYFVRNNVFTYNANSYFAMPDEAVPNENFDRLNPHIDRERGVIYLSNSQSIYLFDYNSPGTLLAQYLNASAGCQDDWSIVNPGTAMVTDSEGNLYVRTCHKIHKYSAPAVDNLGAFVPGQLTGWLGKCTGNNAPYSACDEDGQTSKGFSCTDEKCTSEAFPAQSTQPGQFDNLSDININPRDVLYVADFNNSRVQRFSTEGVFSGEAKSTGAGVTNEASFVLGNMGKPKYVAVNSSSFYVLEDDADNGDYFLHIFKSTPFYDITDNSAKVNYVSNYNFQGQDQFTFITDDGLAKSNIATVSVALSRAHRPPEKLAVQCLSSFTTIDNLSDVIPCVLNEDSNIVVRISSQDPDGFIRIDGLDSHTFTITDAPANGQLLELASTDYAAIYRYTANADFNGEDGFSFNANDGVFDAEEEGVAQFTVTPQPDPVVVDLPTNIMAARGFSRLFNFEFNDIDEDHQPQLLRMAWGDGTDTLEPDWVNSGRKDQEGIEISPQIDFVTGRGLLLGSHLYSSVGNQTLAVLMVNHAADGSLLEPTQATTNVEVIEATMLASSLVEPVESVEPLVPFSIKLDITNHLPEGWSGLDANNTRVSIGVPEGLTLISLDPRCSGSASAGLDCVLDTLRPGQTEQIQLVASIALEAARQNQDYPLKVTLIDDGPHIQDMNKVWHVLTIADQDDDGIIDVDDAFSDDERYSQDADKDRMADEWEQRYGLNSGDAADAAIDSDGDGTSNLQEFTNGTYPMLADAVLATDALSLPDVSDNQLGFKVAAGDINGDGYADVVAGAPNYQNQGAIVIYYGADNGVSASQPMSVASTTGFGRAVAVGDVNNDGFADIAVASEQDVYLYLGSATSLSAPVVIARPDSTATKFGNALLIADIDNDGLSDLLVTSPEDDQNGFMNNGAVYVYRATSQYWTNALPVPGMVLTINVPSFGLGDGLAVADINGDSIADLMVGAAFADNGWVAGYLGHNIDWTLNLSDRPDFTLQGETVGDRFGFSLASAQDIDGDGVSDLVVGAYSNNGIGAAYVYRSTDQFWIMPLPVQPEKIQSGNNGDQFGVSVLMTKPTTYTGASAIIVGANRVERDTAPDEGQVAYYSFSDLTTSWFTDYGRTRDMLGYALVDAGDVNGDGEGDIAVGAPDISNGSYVGNGGFVQIYYGSTGRQQTDTDKDNVADQFDNCVNVANTDQVDSDADGAGDVCDTNDGTTGGGGSGGGGSFAPWSVMLILMLLVLQRGVLVLRQQHK